MDPVVGSIAEVLYAVNPDRQSWDGDPFGFQTALDRGEHRAALAVKQATLLAELGFVDGSKILKTPVNMWDVRREHGIR